MKKLLTTLILIIGLLFLTVCINKLQNTNNSNNNSNTQNKITLPLNLNKTLKTEKIDLVIDQTITTSEGKSIKNFNDLKGKKVGSLTGSTFDDLAKKYLPSVKIMSFSQINQQIVEINSGKLDAMLLDTPQAIYLLAEQPNLTRLTQTMPVGDYAFGFNKNNTKLEKAFSKEIVKMNQDGTLKQLQEKWLSANRINQTMPPINKQGKKLIIGIFAESPPFAFIRNNEIAGYEVELAILIANKLGYKTELLPMDFSAMISSLQSGKIDIISGSISITPERQESILFSNSIYDGSVSVIIKKNIAKDTNIRFIQSVKNSWQTFKEGFNKTFIKENRWQLILKGLFVTVIITFFAVILGTILAFPLCMLNMSKNKFLSLCSEKYISIMQGTPILVILMILYYVIFAKIDINAIIVAIIAFALDFAAYTSIMLRSGIEGVPKGQTEASLALGFTPSQSFLNFILPQAVRSILPVYRSEIISTLKSTSIVGYIAIMDLTKMSDIIRSRTYDAFFPLVSTAIIYFLIAKCLTSLLILIENKVNPKYRRDKILKRGVK